MEKRGVDFLGCHFAPDELSVAEKTLHIVERANGRGAGTGGARRLLPKKIRPLRGKVKATARYAMRSQRGEDDKSIECNVFNP